MKIHLGTLYLMLLDENQSLLYNRVNIHTIHYMTIYHGTLYLMFLDAKQSLLYDIVNIHTTKMYEDMPWRSVFDLIGCKKKSFV